MNHRSRVIVAGLLGALFLAGRPLHSQRVQVLATAADDLLEEGRWAEAESAFYAQSEAGPRDPRARAALGRFLCMKGAIRPGIILIEEARKFGLDAAAARDLIAPWRAILDWRSSALEFKHDSVFVVRGSHRDDVLFEIALPRTDHDGRSNTGAGVSEIVWHDVIDRAVGLDSINKRGRPMGIDIFEALAPSIYVRDGELTLHANSRSALSANGRRYQVLRTPRGVRVLIGDRRVEPLADALRDLAPTWWQLDLTRGLLVVR